MRGHHCKRQRAAETEAEPQRDGFRVIATPARQSENSKKGSHGEAGMESEQLPVRRQAGLPLTAATAAHGLGTWTIM